MPRPRARRRRNFIVAIYGQPAAGKSYLASQLAEEFDLPVYAIDDMRDQHGTLAWPAMLTHLRRADCIAESCIIPRNYQALLIRGYRLHVRCVADDDTRRDRLITRGLDAETVDRFLTSANTTRRDEIVVENGSPQAIDEVRNRIEELRELTGFLGGAPA